jgi:hypothetical protein
MEGFGVVSQVIGAIAKLRQRRARRSVAETNVEGERLRVEYDPERPEIE